jgi:hypothetical protein
MIWLLILACLPLYIIIKLITPRSNAQTDPGEGCQKGCINLASALVLLGAFYACGALFDKKEVANHESKNPPIGLPPLVVESNPVGGGAPERPTIAPTSKEERQVNEASPQTASRKHDMPTRYSSDYELKKGATRVLILKGRIYVISDEELAATLSRRLSGIKAALRYDVVSVEQFRPMLKEVFGNPGDIESAWPLVSSLSSSFQLDQVALGYRILDKAGFECDPEFLLCLSRLAIVFRRSFPAVAAASVAVVDGNVEPWRMLDPERDPIQGRIGVKGGGKRLIFRYRDTNTPVEPTPNGIVDYIKVLCDIDEFKHANDAHEIYDAYRVVNEVNRQLRELAMVESWLANAIVRPGRTFVQVVLTPRPDGGEVLRACY